MQTDEESPGIATATRLVQHARQLAHDIEIDDIPTVVIMLIDTLPDLAVTLRERFPGIDTPEFTEKWDGFHDASLRMKTAFERLLDVGMPR